MIPEPCRKCRQPMRQYTLWSAYGWWCSHCNLFHMIAPGRDFQVSPALVEEMLQAYDNPTSDDLLYGKYSALHSAVLAYWQAQDWRSDFASIAREYAQKSVASKPNLR